MRLPIDVVMKRKGTKTPQNSEYLKYSAIIGDIAIIEQPEKIVDYSIISDLNFDNPLAISFLKMGCTVFNFKSNMFESHPSGGYHLDDPIPFNRLITEVKPRQTDNRFCLPAFNSCRYHLPQELSNALAHLYYNLILPDILESADAITGDSDIVMMTGPWTPPHAHVVNFADPSNDITVSYGVRISGSQDPTVVFDFFSTNFIAFTDNNIFKATFHGTHLHQLVKQQAENNLYFFFVFDGVKLKDTTMNLHNHVYVEKWKSIC